MTEITMPARTLITGPSGAGKTRLTASAMREWTRAHGSKDLAVLEFGPDLSHEDRLIGGRIDRWEPLPPNAWTAVVDTNAPRIEGDDESQQRRLAAENALVCRDAIERLPVDRRAVIVNDATIPFQEPGADPGILLDRLEDVPHVVMNAYEGEGFGSGSITEQEADVLAQFRAWVDEEIRLESR